jgi:Mrp family chromosome partitioning ATPase
VASSRPGEGTTAVATGLAVAWARAGERVVLVDANVRAPRLGALVTTRSRPDLVALLERESAHDLIAGALRPTAIDGLLVLTCEPERPFARDLVASRRMEHVIDELRTLADRVIVDGAPVAAGETVALAHCVDATIVVVDARRSRGADVRRSSAVIREAATGAVEGAVLNYA